MDSKKFLQGNIEENNQKLVKDVQHVHNEKVKNRNTVPSSIYIHFTNFIEKKEVPDVMECIDVYKESPSYCKYWPEDIQNLVRRAVHFEDESKS